MDITIKSTANLAAQTAGKLAAANLQLSIEANGRANLVLATGVSQYEVYAELVAASIDWGRVSIFQLDEYIGLPATHEASFAHYLRTRFIDRVGSLADVHLIDAMAQPAQECERLCALLENRTIDVCLAGLGENGHLAFNDPIADFATTQSYIVVDLKPESRQQQVGQGLFESIEAVPLQAISMSIHQIMKSRLVVCTAIQQRKAKAVERTLQGEVSAICPASILQQHPDCHLFLDAPAASLLVSVAA